MKWTIPMVLLTIPIVSCAAKQTYDINSNNQEVGRIEAPGGEAGGEAARAALAQVDFLTGNWEGEGWSQSSNGTKRRFWVKEYYQYRGARDLMDMEGRFGDIDSDGKRMPEQEFGLGILYFDEQNREYRMWHYSNSAEVMDVKMNVDVSKQELYYLKDLESGEKGRFHLVVSEDGEWISRFDILDEGEWVQVMEFRMHRSSN